MTSTKTNTTVDKKTLEEWLNSNDVHLEYKCLLHDYGLDTLVNSKNVAIRMKMAELDKN